MKSIINIISIVAIAVSFAACSEKTTEKAAEATSDSTEQTAAATYYCPMKCEGDKTYAEKGTCPVCKMDLVEVVAEQHEHSHDSHEGHQH